MDMPVADIQSVYVAQASSAYLNELKRMKGFGAEAMRDDTITSGLRLTAIRQEGLKVGGQGGLSVRYGEIVSYLDANESRLNVIFSFAPFVDGKLLLPAIASEQGRVKLEGGNATVIKSSYTITDEAKIIASVPTWRDYLYQEYARPAKPHHSILPKTKAEQVAWERAVEEGWNGGLVMADEIFSDRLAALTKSVEDRYRYKTLLQQRVVAAPKVDVSTNAITYNGRSMNVGEVLYSVSTPVNYTASPTWRAVWSK